MRIQNCTSRSSSGGRGIGSSAARTRVTASRTSTPPSSRRARPARANAFPHVEFIYTPVNPKFDSAFKGLSPPRLYGGSLSDRKHVDDLDTSLPVDRPEGWQRVAHTAATEVKSLA